MKEVGREEGLPVVDAFEAVWEAAGGREEALEEFFEDGLHLLPKGYNLVVEGAVLSLFFPSSSPFFLPCSQYFFSLEADLLHFLPSRLFPTSLPFQPPLRPPHPLVLPAPSAPTGVKSVITTHYPHLHWDTLPTLFPYWRDIPTGALGEEFKLKTVGEKVVG